MPMLLLDLADEASASDARTADRLDAEARELGGLAQDAEDAQRRRLPNAARQATALALARLPQAEATMAAAVEALGAKLATGEEVSLLGGVLRQAEAALRLVRLARELWAEAERRGFVSERSPELEEAQKRLERMAQLLRGDIRHRTHPWKPKDPERFASEMARVKDAKFFTTEEVLASLRLKQ